jgi:hypothetical protein
MSTTLAPPGTAPAAQAAESEPLYVRLRETPQAPAIDAATFRETIAFLTPDSADMKWASIPWQTDLWEARKLAAKENKPIFMWSMNGNPLGCV